GPQPPSQLSQHLVGILPFAVDKPADHPTQRGVRRGGGQCDDNGDDHGYGVQPDVEARTDRGGDPQVDEAETDGHQGVDQRAAQDDLDVPQAVSQDGRGVQQLRGDTEQGVVVPADQWMPGDALGNLLQDKVCGG